MTCDNGDMSAIVRPADTRAPDPICAAAVDEASAAVLADAGPEAVGRHLGFVPEGEREITHRFVCTMPGYQGWEWRVAVVRAKRSRTVTVSEVSMAPGDEALAGPAWIPWSDRLRPGDLTAGAVAPTDPQEPRLAPGWSGSDDLETELDPGPLHPVNWEAMIQRRRVPSAYGRESTAARWYAGEQGPRNPITKSAPGECGSCGWMMNIGGPLGQMFGVCTNLLSPSDGGVVSFDHGCGGHSEGTPTLVRPGMMATTLDELTLDELDMEQD